MADFHDLVGIPGFYVDDGGYWNIAGYSGLLVPYCDKSGLIQGMQIRLDDENKPDRKYRWLLLLQLKIGKHRTAEKIGYKLGLMLQFPHE